MITTIKSLRSIDSDSAQGILSEVTDALLPNPAPEPEWLTDARNTSGSPDIRQKVLAEVRQRLKIKPQDDSREAVGKLLEYLGTLMSSYAFDGVDTVRIKQRLGERGDLAPELYDVAISPDCRRALYARSIKALDVEDLIHHPDAVQHLLPGKFFDALSLYVKRHATANHFNDYILVAETCRRGATQEVNQAWRIYLSDVNLSRATEPVDILKAFTDAYGLNLTVGVSEPSKFFLHQAIAMTPGLPSSAQKEFAVGATDPKRFSVKVEKTGVTLVFAQGEVQLSKVDNPEDHTIEGSLRWRVSPLNIVEVGIAYTIDMNKYKESLNRHGVDTSHLRLEAHFSFEVQELGHG